MRIPSVASAPPRWPARSSVIPGAIQINRKTFDELDMLIRGMQQGSRQFDAVMDVLVRLCATAHLGLAQKQSRGTMSSQGTAGRPWVIPVRRITQEYYRGWQVRRMRSGAYMMFNPTRHAFAIEFGINPRATKQAVRRPVIKMSAVATLRFVQRTKVAQRLMKDSFGNLRNNKGQFRSFKARMGGSTVLGVAGPQGKLPG